MSGYALLADRTYETLADCVRSDCVDDFEDVFKQNDIDVYSRRARALVLKARSREMLQKMHNLGFPLFRGYLGHSPLTNAARHHSVDVVAYLLEHGAHVNVRMGGGSALHAALKRRPRAPEIVEKLVLAGAVLDDPDDLIHDANERVVTAVLRTLQPNVLEETVFRAAACAAGSDMEIVLRVATKFAFSLTTINSAGYTVLEHAIRSHNSEAACFLARFAILRNRVNMYGETPIQVARGERLFEIENQLGACSDGCLLP